MANLRANRITSTEVFETTGSVQLINGDNDYLTIPASSDLQINLSTSFTVEAWVYVTSYGTYNYIISKGGTATTREWAFGLTPNSVIFYWSTDGTSFGDSVFSISTTNATNTWIHLAFVKIGSVMKIFKNGIQLGSDGYFTSIYDGNGLTTIGRFMDYTGISHSHNGFISNLRILKGTALYTKNFTPPTRELEVIPNTVLLCAQSKTRANEERTGKTITVNGNAVANELTPGLLTNVVKSGGSSAITGSVEFDGTGDYLAVSGTSTDFAFGTEDFTIEGWFYRNVSATYQILIDFRLDASTDVAPLLYLVSGVPYLYTVGGDRINGGQSVSNNSWFHLALCRSGTNTRLFLNGIQIGSTYSDSNNYVNKSNRPIIGAEGVTVGNNPFNGFISNLRVIKGQALYTSNFIPPTRKLTKLPGTVLLCCTDSGNPLKEETGKTILLNGTGSTYSVGIGTTTPNPSKFTPYTSTDGSVVLDGATKFNSKNYFYLPTGPTEQRGRGRGVFGGGVVFPSTLNTIDYINIQSTGNSQDFGDLTVTTRRGLGSCSSSTRGIFAGGYSTPSFIRSIEYITLSTQSNSISFGDLTDDKFVVGGLSNNIRGIFGGGEDSPASHNIIDYITIASTGNAVDFGDMITNQLASYASCSSPIRGIFAGGFAYIGSSLSNVIQYVTISSTGNSQDFGDLTIIRASLSGCSSSIRGVFGGGNDNSTPSVALNVIDYVTIASTGNSVDFGDLISIYLNKASCSSSTRGIFAGGVNPSAINSIEYVTIASTGNSQDFGDLTSARGQFAGCSDSHGGLG